MRWLTQGTKRALSALAGLAILLSTPAAGAQEVWSMATPWPGGAFFEDAKNFANYVEQLTDGRIKIEVFPGGTLGKPLKVTATVESGVAQIGHNWPGYDWGIDKTTVVFANMAGGLTPEELIFWYTKAGADQLLEEYRRERFNVMSVFCGVNPTEIFLHSKKRIETLDDYKGIKQRTAGAWAEIGGALGASTVILPGAEVYPALERGVIDATEWGSPSVNLPVGFHKIAKYIIMPGVHQPGATEECPVNLDAWNRISDRDRELIKLAGRLNALESWTRHAYADIAALKEFENSGNEIVQLSPDFIAAANKAADEWADNEAGKNEWFKRVLDDRRSFQADMAAWPRFRFKLGER
ncbi:MAG: C4-dicarboxylate ABC transporter substrate-binding protein [Gammaproteobacteria bacterium]